MRPAGLENRSGRRSEICGEAEGEGGEGYAELDLTATDYSVCSFGVCGPDCFFADVWDR